MKFTNEKWVLKSHPDPKFETSNCSLEVETLDSDELQENEVIIHMKHLSVGAFIRTMLLDDENFHGSAKIGDVVPAIGVGELVSSRNKGAKVGSVYVFLSGAQRYWKGVPTGDMKAVPMEASKSLLGVLGADCGMSAYLGVYGLNMNPPRKGHICVVSAAAGGLGHMVSQMYKYQGATVIGICGGEKKKDWVKTNLKIEYAIDYKNENVGDRLDEIAPDGVDYFFDVVGGSLLETLIEKMKRRGKIVIGGGISQYDTKKSARSANGPTNYLKIAEKCLQVEGFALSAEAEIFQERFLGILPIPPVMVWLNYWSWRGYLKCYDTEIEFDKFPEAVKTLYGGYHVGKLMINMSSKKTEPFPAG